MACQCSPCFGLHTLPSAPHLNTPIPETGPIFWWNMRDLVAVSSTLMLWVKFKTQVWTDGPIVDLWRCL